MHRDYVETVKPWATEEHIGPANMMVRLGSVNSWALYVKRFSRLGVTPFLTWNNTGLRAVLDYHDAGKPNRCQWGVEFPFTLSREWLAWTAIANGRGIGQQAALEFFEDHAADIHEPVPVDLMGILRSLRTNVSAQAATELHPDGTTSVSFMKSSSVKAAGGTLDLPGSFVIRIPVLHGHRDDKGKPVVYGLRVRLRASVGDSAQLVLRMGLQDAEGVLEEVQIERVAEAQAYISETILRAAD